MEIRDFIEDVRGERAELRSDEPGPDDDEKSSRTWTPRSCFAAPFWRPPASRASRPFSLDVISPLILADDDDPKSLLAGEFMGDFGGFLSEELRASDFNLGYEAATAWLERGLPECELPDSAVSGAIASVRDHAPPGEAGKPGRPRRATFDRGPLQIVRLAAHTARVAGSGWLDLRAKVPDSIGKLLRKRS